MKKFLIIVLSLLFLICTGLTAACSGSCSNETEPDKEFPDVPAAEAEIMQLTIASKTIAVGDTFTIKVLGVEMNCVWFHDSVFFVSQFLI